MINAVTSAVPTAGNPHADKLGRDFPEVVKVAGSDKGWLVEVAAAIGAVAVGISRGINQASAVSNLSNGTWDPATQPLPGSHPNPYTGGPYPSSFP